MSVGYPHSVLGWDLARWGPAGLSLRPVLKGPRAVGGEGVITEICWGGERAAGGGAGGKPGIPYLGFPFGECDALLKLSLGSPSCCGCSLL